MPLTRLKISQIRKIRRKLNAFLRIWTELSISMVLKAEEEEGLAS
jgi:hypothetical protein